MAKKTYLKITEREFEVVHRAVKIIEGIEHIEGTEKADSLIFASLAVLGDRLAVVQSKVDKRNGTQFSTY